MSPHPQHPTRPLFTEPVELHCTLDPATEMRRFIPLLAFSFLFFGLVGAVIIGIATPGGSPVLHYGAGAVVGAVVSGLMFARLRSRLTRTYGSLQRLRLTPQGMERTDGTLATVMPWPGMQRFETCNSALPSRKVNVASTGVAGAGANAVLNAANTKMATGIVGQATLFPLPGANRVRLRAHDRLSGGRSNLRGGQPFQTPQGVIFPAEFEQNWQHGVIGSWLRHYRPDLDLPA